MIETRTYTILATHSALGREGETVTLTAQAAKYWLLGGVIAEGKVVVKKGGK
jgi:hypothetical protein